MIHFGNRFGVVLFIPDTFLKLWDWRGLVTPRTA